MKTITTHRCTLQIHYHIVLSTLSTSLLCVKANFRLLCRNGFASGGGSLSVVYFLNFSYLYFSVLDYSMPIQYPYLISRWVDPVVSVAIGVAAYYLHERRIGRPEGHSLNELLAKKYSK